MMSNPDIIDYGDHENMLATAQQGDYWSRLKEIYQREMVAESGQGMPE